MIRRQQRSGKSVAEELSRAAHADRIVAAAGSGKWSLLADDIKLLKRSLFGNRCERIVDDPGQRTFLANCWNSPDPAHAEPTADGTEEDPAAQPSEETKGKPRRGGKRGRIVMPEWLPRKEVVPSLQESEIPEHLRGRNDLRRFRKKVGQYLEVTEPSAHVVEEYVEVLAADNEDATATDWQAQREKQKQRLPRMDVATYRNWIRNVLAQIVRNGRRTVDRLLAWNPWQATFFGLADRIAQLSYG